MGVGTLSHAHTRLHLRLLLRLEHIHPTPAQACSREHACTLVSLHSNPLALQHPRSRSRVCVCVLARAHTTFFLSRLSACAPRVVPQGGPLMHVIAAKAVAFREALQPSFKHYAHAVVENAQTLSDTLIKGGCNVVSGGVTFPSASVAPD